MGQINWVGYLTLLDQIHGLPTNTNPVKKNIYQLLFKMKLKLPLKKERVSEIC